MLRPSRFVVVVLALAAVLATACDPIPNPNPPGVSSQTVAAGNGFGGGTIYYPTGVTTRMGAVVAAPGFTEGQAAVQVYGPMLAQNGFVVFTIDTNTVFDDPSSRATQLLKAVDYLTGSSDVRNLVDPSKVAVMGHSMGGGGALIAATRRPSLKAAIPMAPWNSSSTNFSADRVPTLFLTCQNDGIAPNDSHSLPFYASIGSNVPKAYLQVAGAGHMCTNVAQPAVDPYLISWLKHFVNGTSSVSVCPPPAQSVSISRSLSNCPF